MAVGSDNLLQDLFMQCTFLAEHLKMGSTLWIMILPSMEKSFVEKQGLVCELQAALKLLSINATTVHGEADGDMEDTPVDLYEETEENEDQQNLSKCTRLYQAISLKYKTHLAGVRKAYLDGTHSRVDRDSRANLPMHIYEEHHIALTKHIQLPPIFLQLLQEESKREAELVKQRSLSEGDTPQGDFDKELGMECLRLSGKEMGNIEFERLALLQVWTEYKDAEQGRQQCLLCLHDDRLPDAIHYQYFKIWCKFLEHQKTNHGDKSQYCSSTNLSKQWAEEEEFLANFERTLLPDDASPMTSNKLFKLQTVALGLVPWLHPPFLSFLLQPWSKQLGVAGCISPRPMIPTSFQQVKCMQAPSHPTKCGRCSATFASQTRKDKQAKEEAQKVLQPHSHGTTAAVLSDKQRQEIGQNFLEGCLPQLDNPCGYILIGGVKAGTSFSWVEIEQAHQLITGLAAADQARCLQIKTVLLNLQREGAGLELVEEDWEEDFVAEHIEALYDNHKAAIIETSKMTDSSGDQRQLMHEDSSEIGLHKKKKDLGDLEVVTVATVMVANKVRPLIEDDGNIGPGRIENTASFGSVQAICTLGNAHLRLGAPVIYKTIWQIELQSGPGKLNHAVAHMGDGCRLGKGGILAMGKLA
ncbi:hypothetical protein IW262DRAFT_1300255 [Armillaria fumosa]|nr:hypothetical protein IW262DRAFT_1300255 [Armillaria fumosa]